MQNIDEYSNLISALNDRIRDQFRKYQLSIFWLLMGNIIAMGCSVFMFSKMLEIYERFRIELP